MHWNYRNNLIAEQSHIIILDNFRTGDYNLEDNISSFNFTLVSLDEFSVGQECSSI